MIIFLEWVRPFTMKSIARVETISEVANFFSLYLMLGFNDYISDAQTRSDFGWILITIICLFVGLHIYIMFAGVFSSLRNYYLLNRVKINRIIDCLLCRTPKPTDLPKSGYKYEEKPEPITLKPIEELSEEDESSYDSESYGEENEAN